MSKKKKDLARIKALNSLAMKRYKVSVLTVGLHNFTVTAMSEQDAHDKVLNGEGGRDAGKEGPVPFAVRIHDMSMIETEALTLNRMMQEMMGSMQEQAVANARKASGPNAPMIQVVSG